MKKKLFPTSNVKVAEMLFKTFCIFSKAALMWSKKYCDSSGQKLSEVLNGFLGKLSYINLFMHFQNYFHTLDYINFHMIPANVLMKEIHPLGLVPYHVIMNALAYQADPTSVEPLKQTSKEVLFLLNFQTFSKPDISQTQRLLDHNLNRTIPEFD